MPERRATQQISSAELARLHAHIYGIVRYFAIPALAAGALQLWVVPRWQSLLLLATTVVLVGSWHLAHRRVQARRDREATALVLATLSLHSAVLLFVRRDSLPIAGLSFLTGAVYVSLYSPRQPIVAGALLLGALLPWELLNANGLLPLLDLPPWLKALFDLGYSMVMVPFLIFMLRERERIDGLALLAAERTSLEQRQLLETLAQVQPQLRGLVSAMASVAAELGSQSREQAAASAAAADAMEQLEQMFAQAASAASQTRALSEQTRADTDQSWQKLTDAEQQLTHFGELLAGVQAATRRLTEQAERTEEIIEGIREVDEQVNVLALNASIEAAQAGEAGKGFAVVAGELRTMIAETGSNVRRGRSLLESVRREAGYTLRETTASAQRLQHHVRDLRNASGLVQQIFTSFLSTTEKVQLIAVAAESQREQLAEAMGSIRDLRRGAEALAGSADRLAERVQGIAGANRELDALVARYRGDPGEAPPA